MTAPMVSVLVTACNRERHLAASMGSVLAQTFGDFELIVVDAGSTDATLDRAREFERRDARVRVVATERDLGDCANRNRATGLARGALLKYHDPRDVMYRHCLAAMVPPMVAYPEAGLGLSGGRFWIGGPCPMLMTPRQSYQREFLGSTMFNAGLEGAIFRAEALGALGGFVDAGPASGYLFWLRACARVPVLLLPADTSWYRPRDARAATPPEAVTCDATAVRETWAALADPDCPLTPDETERARRNVLWMHAKAVRQDLGARRFGRGWARLAAGPTPAEWLRYFRRPRREMFAGTPFDDRGAYLTPRHMSAR